MAEGKFIDSTKKQLQKLNAFRCANPDCRHYTLAAKAGNSGLYTAGEAAHIEGRKVGTARYNPDSTDEKRADISNALWLCSRCHSMVDPDGDRYPVPLLRKWKDMSESIHNYSNPIMAFGSRCFFYGQLSDQPGMSSLGGHLTIGPSNLDGICTECWIEGLSAEGRFKVSAERLYHNENTGEAIKTVMEDDWHPFLTRIGMDHLTRFVGPVPGYRKFLAYRIGVVYQILGRDFVFHSHWELGALTKYQDLYHLYRKTGTLLAPWIDWVFENVGRQDAKRMLAIFNYDTLHVRSYPEADVYERNPSPALQWEPDGKGAASCFGEMEGGVTFGFIQEGIKCALVVSTLGTPTDQLIKTDQPSRVVTFQ